MQPDQDSKVYNQAAAKKAGAEFYFGTTAEYIIMENGAVAGLVASDADGYVKITCKAVVCACGGMGGNPDMMAYFMPDMAQTLVEGESLSSMSANDGRGVQMAYWAGAHLETTPIPGMNMKGLSVPGKMNCLPQAVWIDESGRRFCNEFYPTSEQRGYQTTFMSRKTKYAVCDNNFTEYRQYTLPQHAGFNATEENIAALRESLDKAYAKLKGTYEEPEQTEGEGGPGGHGPMTEVEFIADDTLEGLAGQLGLTGDAASRVRRPDRALQRLLRGRRRRRVRPRRRGALPGEGRPLLRLHLRSGSRRDHGHHGRHHHRWRAERARRQLRADPRPVHGRKRLRSPLRHRVHHPHPGCVFGLRAGARPRVRQVRGEVPRLVVPTPFPLRA